MTNIPSVGDDVPARSYQPTALDLFLFSASAWLLHRIHYDTPFTKEHEGHPGLLIHGPLQGVYLTQVAEAYLGDIARIESISYRHHAPAFLGDELECAGTVTAVGDRRIDLDLWARNSAGTDTTTGRARFALR